AVQHRSGGKEGLFELIHVDTGDAAGPLQDGAVVVGGGGGSEVEGVGDDSGADADGGAARGRQVLGAEGVADDGAGRADGLVDELDGFLGDEVAAEPVVVDDLDDVGLLCTA